MQWQHNLLRLEHCCFGLGTMPHLKHLFNFNGELAGRASLLFLTSSPLLESWRAVQHAQAMLCYQVHAVPCIWVVLCHLMEVFLQANKDLRVIPYHYMTWVSPCCLSACAT